jgi:hypothetical protein
LTGERSGRPGLLTDNARSVGETKQSTFIVGQRRVRSLRVEQGAGRDDPGSGYRLPRGSRRARLMLESRFEFLVIHHTRDSPQPARMGPFRPLHFFLTLLAVTVPFTVASAQDTPVLDRPNDKISHGQPLRDNVLLFPANGQLVRNQIDGLLGLSKLWSRQQQVACSTNYTQCQGTQFCCPTGNSCCSGERPCVSWRTRSLTGCGL